MNTIAKPDIYTYPLSKWFGRILKPQDIHIKGFSFEEPITVQVIEDDIVTYCNHDGAEIGVVTHEYFYGEGIEELTKTGKVCDKCDAWQDIDGVWHE